jgi:hypothetical protein
MAKSSEKCEDKELNNGITIANNQKSVTETKLSEKVKKPATTVDEVTELLSAASVSGGFRQKTFKVSPLQLKGKEETQEERRKRALEEQKKVRKISP